jgi:hypothetical protein
VTAPPPAAARHRTLLHDARGTLEELQAAQRRYLESHPYRLVHHYDPRGARYTVRVQVTAAVPGGLALLAGRVLREARASLDALATALVPNPAGASRGIRFPIHDSLPEFAQRSRRAIGEMSDDAQATIEALQPYHTFGGFQKDALWLLRELGSTDAPALAAGAVRGGTELGVNTKRHVEIVGDLRVAPGAFEDGTVIASVAASVAGPDPKLDLFLRPTFELAFATDGPARGASLVGALGAVCDRVEAVIVALEPTIPG